MFEKMTMREWSTSSTPTTPAPGLLSLAEPLSTDTIVSYTFGIKSKSIKVVKKITCKSVCIKTVRSQKVLN